MDVDGDGEQALVGSLSRVTGKSMQMDDLLPDWLENGVESSLRDSDDDVQAVAVPVAVSVAVPPPTLRDDLDLFYEESEYESEEDSS